MKNFLKTAIMGAIRSFLRLLLFFAIGLISSPISKYAMDFLIRQYAEFGNALYANGTADIKVFLDSFSHWWNTLSVSIQCGFFFMLLFEGIFGIIVAFKSLKKIRGIERKRMPDDPDNFGYKPFKATGANDNVPEALKKAAGSENSNIVSITKFNGSIKKG